MTRREAIAALGAFPCAAQTLRAAAAPMAFTGLDHLEFFVSDVQRSIRFYTAVFSGELWKNRRTARRYLKLGSAYIAFEEGRDFHVDHFTAAVENFDIQAAHKFLQERGIEYKDYPSGRDLYVADPDGNRLQLTDAKSWATLTANTASPEPIEGAPQPAFRTVALDHILLNVSDPEKAASLFQQVLGVAPQREPDRIWLPVAKARLGLTQTPQGRRPGVGHFCLIVDPFEGAAASRKVQQAGSHLDFAEDPASPQLRDPDGYLIHIKTA
jgi:catechol 2,3-dioxygenase-like lactoylglutathione lyase family enzyme